MSFLHYKDIIEEGDLVMAFISRNDIKPVIAKSGATLNTRYGVFPHDLMIGARYGEQIASAKGYGFIHLLQPTPELWTLSLPHRTQIVYTFDSSYVVQRLRVLPGSRVIEAGTGSGSFSHAFARTIHSNGRLFSYEFHRPRYEEAKGEFEIHKLDNITLTHRDVCTNGFKVDGVDVDGDAVFLDLPAPWEAIKHLDEVVAKDRRVSICCFSPCIEQVVKTIEALTANKWNGIEMVEVSGRKWEAHREMVRDVDEAVARLKDIKKRAAAGLARKRKLNKISDEVDNEDADIQPDEDNDISSEEPSGKSETEPNLKSDQKSNQDTKDRGYNPFGKGKRIREGDPAYKWINVTRSEPEVKSHTSYLTFAYRNQ
ncbi:BA75_00471T0 [Komagataella pastoris]|uniref:tRNA (adenine(58)-N(1))-methyltransferase catalytic subunit TRM61 n=1 Tax=Komagataella pastoris TaxID=4922 RepID=A0A1B2J605_PICPA|nr:BA75_00471T0 [Komagataella pastoris]